jgi:hypothetical protein
LELGEASKDKIADVKDKILKSIGDGDFTKLQDALERKEFSKAQVEQMRELIDDEINVLLGPLQYLIFDIPFLSDVEDYIGDQLISEELEEKLRKTSTSIELDSENFENSCEK